MDVRKAVLSDAPALSLMLKDLAAVGKRTLPSDEDYVQSVYIGHEDTLQCTIAVNEAGRPLGLQILKRATAGNPYGVPVGWVIIGTHVHPDAARRGVGKSLFQESCEVARQNDIRHIDATIGEQNAEGLGYYEAMGFRTERTVDGKVHKVFELN